MASHQDYPDDTYDDGHEVHAVEASRHGDVPTGYPSKEEEQDEEKSEKGEIRRGDHPPCLEDTSSWERTAGTEKGDGEKNQAE